MLKILLTLVAINFFAPGAMADDGVCKPMATLARMSAEQRDRGIAQDVFLKRLVREGKLDPQDSSAAFVINTVVWVYEENIPTKSAYAQMYQKCHKAFSKKRQ